MSNVNPDGIGARFQLTVSSGTSTIRLGSKRLKRDGSIESRRIYRHILL